MFSPGLLRLGDPGLAKARARGAEVIFASVRQRGVGEADVVPAVIASMSWAHGFVGLWKTGNLAGLGDPIDLARRSAEGLGRLASRG